jgi:hypothetical protein
MAQRDATKFQQRKLKAIIKEFGKSATKTYRVDPHTGIMRVELTCAAGVWHWWFDEYGEMVDSALHRQMEV